MPSGRPRDEDARIRILGSVVELVASRAPGQVTINEIARAASVGKQTIYRWWPSKTAVVLDALVEGTMKATPFRATDDIRSDFERHLRSVAVLFASPTGSVIRELVADAQSDPQIADEFRDRFWAPRRELSLDRLRRGVDLGRVRDDLDLEVVLDAVYGPMWLRLLIGHLPVRASDATAIGDAVWPGIDTGGDFGPETR